MARRDLSIILPGCRKNILKKSDFSRFDAGGKIVEHWDAIQKIPETSANQNGIY